MNAPMTTGKLVLIVDDVEDNRVLLDRALRSSGYATVQAASGREALSLISRQVPTMVLLDWMMPEFSGLETLRAIRELYPKERLPVIMCTAIDDEMSVVSAIGQGANDYILKPISLPILRARMAAHLEQHETISTLMSEKLEAERQLGQQARSMFIAMARQKEEDGRPSGPPTS